MNKLRRRGSDDPDLVPHERFDYNTVDDTWSPEASYTIEEAIEKIGFGRFQMRVTFYCGMIWIADSMEIMVLNILGPVLICQWRISSIEEALITTVVFGGYLVGSPLCGYIGDTYGRRTALILSAAWAVYYGLLSALSPRYAWLLILRGLLGVGVSGVPQSVTYVSEFLPNKDRGKCIMTLEIFWACGTLLEVALAMWILQSYGWRWWLAASAVPLMLFLAITAVTKVYKKVITYSFTFWSSIVFSPLLLLVLGFVCSFDQMFYPESPRYQLACGDVDKAEATLIKIAKENRTTLPRGRLRGESHVERGKFTDLFSPDFLRTTILLWIIWFITASSYYGIVLVSTEIIKSETPCLSDGLGREESCSDECKLLTNRNYIELMWTSFAEMPGLLLTMVLIDRVGRKMSMYIELFAYGLVCFLLFICTGRIGLITLFFCARALISSAYQVVYVYTPEVYPTTIRGMALGSCSAAARAGCIMTPFVAQVLLRASLHTAISVYAVSAVIAGVAAFLLPIETKGRSLQNVAH